MMTDVNALDVFSFPLHGQRLIEASAGTGKTFTIAGLYLRLLLGHGQNGASHSKPLTVDQILVVTFTDAATEELRDRIRKRIHDARRAFESGGSNDPILQRLLDDSQEHAEDAITLLNAERQMDESAIYTIHSFCQRMLKQNAFESKSLFTQEIITEQAQLELQAVADFWRREFYLIDKSLSSVIRSYWECPEVLYAKIKSYLTGPLPVIKASEMPKVLSELHQENIAAIDSVKQAWRESAEEIENIMLSAVGSSLNGASYKAANLPSWLDEINQWASSQTLNYQLPKNLEKFSQALLVNKTNKGKSSPSHAVFKQIEALVGKELDFKDRLKKYAIDQVRVILAKEKSRHSWLSFDDLLSNLASALDNNSQGELACRIRELYPVAMIDEFQDTDPLQYSIFNTIYGEEKHAGLFMIGDPKQAIYAFRGADIFTYIKARKTVSYHYNLDTNWRSSFDMVAASNAIFQMAQNPFIYDEDIPFLRVKASPQSENRSWQIDGIIQPALSFWMDEMQIVHLSKIHYEQKMADATAVHIRDLLNAAIDNKACLVRNGQAEKIKPSDIAILVRTGNQAALIKKALAKLGIVSVYLSDRKSVFSSPIAQDLERLLHAVLTPENERALRAAIASSLFALTAEQIDKLNHDEKDWEQAVNEFRQYQDIWFKKGIQPMLRQMIQNRKIAQRLLVPENENGERHLTDLMHIGELLQRASNELDSHHALIRWLKENIKSPNGNAAGQMVRLESERDLVKIVTIHKSKGLEYNLVYLPFICNFRAEDKPFYHDENNKAVLDLQDQSGAIEKAEKERLAEDLRLLYVAITRAVYGCVLGMAAINKGNAKASMQHHSAIGYLLQKGEVKDAKELQQIIHQFALYGSVLGKASIALLQKEDRVALKQCFDTLMAQNEISNAKQLQQALKTQLAAEPEAVWLKEALKVLEQPQNAISLCPLPKITAGVYRPEPATEHEITALEFTAKVARNWRLSSYSNLVKQGHKAELDVATFDIDAARDEALVAVTDENSSEQEGEKTQLAAFSSIFQFPKGARPGTFIHTLFENISFSDDMYGEKVTTMLLRQLTRENYPLDWIAVLQLMLKDVLNAKLHPQGLKLKNISDGAKLNELEFMMSAQNVHAYALNQLIKTHDTLSAKAGNLDFKTVTGMLKGFIDLVFCYQGKYYVLDWKSNYLGDKPEDYNQQALAGAMLDHRYDLQYQLYTLALHRFLRTRIADYSFDKYIGGVFYLFVRGIENGSDNGIFYSKPKQALIEKLDLLFADGVLHAS